jgi:hypothetical protein
MSYTIRDISKLVEIYLAFNIFLINLSNDRVAQRTTTHITGIISIPFLGCATNHIWMFSDKLLGDSIFLSILNRLYGTSNHLQINPYEAKQ